MVYKDMSRHELDSAVELAQTIEDLFLEEPMSKVDDVAALIAVYVEKEKAGLVAEVERLNGILMAIHDRAHELSTGPTVTDGYWEIRAMAGAAWQSLPGEDEGASDNVR